MPFALLRCHKEVESLRRGAPVKKTWVIDIVTANLNEVVTRELVFDGEPLIVILSKLEKHWNMTPVFKDDDGNIVMAMK